MILTRGRIWLCRAVAMLWISVAAVLFYFVTDRDPPYEYVGGEILPAEPSPGDQIAIHWHLKVDRFCPGWVDRTIIDSKKYIWRNVGSPVNNNIARESHIVNTIELPRTIGLGPAIYKARSCYQCNPLHRIWPLCVDPPELPFTIVAPTFKLQSDEP